MAGNVRVVFEGQSFRNKIQRSETETLSVVAHGISGGAREFARELLIRSRMQMKQSGNFASPRWQQGLHVDANPRSGALTNARIDMWHEIPYAHIHEFGGLIKGKPLLWIPLSFAGVPKGLYARDFPGGLFRVNRKVGRPLLFSRIDKEPKYFGIDQVYIPPRWGLSKLSEDLMRNFDSYYERNKSGKR